MRVLAQSFEDGLARAGNSTGPLAEATGQVRQRLLPRRFGMQARLHARQPWRGGATATPSTEPARTALPSV